MYYTFVIKIHTLYIMDVLTWISARLLISDFISWAESERGVSFNHNLFRRAKVAKASKVTDRQRLLLQYAEEFVELQEQKRVTDTATQGSVA